ncbi:MAG: hypothetical protein LBP75_05330 [Planctomycetota bacterium]|nr:hypothetical protein [Planctomycetota bacterium]
MGRTKKTPPALAATDAPPVIDLQSAATARPPKKKANSRRQATGNRASTGSRASTRLLLARLFGGGNILDPLAVKASIAQMLNTGIKTA